MRSSYPYLKLFAMLIPPFLIGSAEYVRHEFWTNTLSMEVGNALITVIVLILSCWLAGWMFRRIEASNARLAEEQAKRAVYVERERLAGELHDNIAQALFFLNVKLQKGRIEEAKSAVAEINNHLRQAIYNLRSLPEEASDFEARLRLWLEEWSGVSGITYNADIGFKGRGLNMAQEVQLFGLIQEAFTNIRKHSRADRATLELSGDGDGWVLTITDNGVGISPEALQYEANRMGGKYGLSMMAKRAEALGACFHMERLDGSGTRITVVMRHKGGQP